MPTIPAMDERHEIAVAAYLEWIRHGENAWHAGACAPRGLIEGRVAVLPKPPALGIYLRRRFVQWRHRSVDSHELLGRCVRNPNPGQGIRTSRCRTDSRSRNARAHSGDTDHEARQNQHR